MPCWERRSGLASVALQEFATSFGLQINIGQVVGIVVSTFYCLATARWDTAWNLGCAVLRCNRISVTIWTGEGPVTVNPLIPRNSNGQPVFPSIDMNGVAIGDMRMLLSDYFDQCWAHQHSNSTSIPWEDIVLNPAKYYAASNFSTTLDHPQNLSTVQVVNLANDLLSTSTMKNPAPFHFLATEGTVLLHRLWCQHLLPLLCSKIAPRKPRLPLPPSVYLQSPSAIEVEEAPPAKTRGKNKRQRTLDDPDKTADNGRVKRKKSRGTEPDTASIQGRGKSAKQLRIKNFVGAAPGIATGAPKKKAKSRGWAWVDSDGNDVEDSD
ncbi:hypothetical protein B0H11DRAFT_1921501 [Mycena galericulata]|nr:hypothetical protein B0H11DRAFT_1921501 [Mycena galericulata]